MAKIATNVMIDEDLKSASKAMAALNKMTFESYLEEALIEKNESVEAKPKGKRVFKQEKVNK